CITLCQAWITAGQPRSSHGRKIGAFEAWADIMGGLLEFIEIPGFLDNLNTFYEEADAEGQLWRRLFGLWWDRHQDREVGTSDIFRLVRGGELPLDLGDAGESSQKPRLGKMLGSMRDRQFDPYRLIVCGKKQGAQRWKLELNA